ncbi:hypothetical protein Syun_002059 [Stephania yunnanensis]|uniref:SAWADEE domain-containing protein n=1 Tax=Stephania yunnanensis TaxID=152371 RepID=A0AAP0LJ28_9MAGN
MEESTDVELEFMRLDDSSWHPCRVSLSPDTSTGFGLIVEFGSHDSQRHVIHTKEEALARLRVRSIALRGGDCLDIKEGKHVLACQKTPLRSVLFDAVVEQVKMRPMCLTIGMEFLSAAMAIPMHGLCIVWVARVRHSKRSLCRCTFVVKWLQSDLHGGTETLPSNSILKLVVKSIDSHPTVHKFFTTVESLGSLGESPFPSFLEDTFCVSDLSSMVEKQVEEIHKLADASRSGSSEEILLVLKKDEAEFTGQARKVSFSGEWTSQVQNNSKRTTRSASKTKQKTKDISPPPIEPEPDNRQHLSPLGARAALASLMSKLSQEAEFSISHLESKDFSNKSLGIHGEHASVVSIDVVDKLFRSGASFKEDVAMIHTNYSQKKVSSVSKNKVQKPESSECIGSDPANVKTSLACFVSDGKENGPLRSTRVTRSSVQKALETSNGKSEARSSAEEMKSSVPVRGTRLTRSMIKNEVQILSVENKQGLEGKPAQSALSDSIDGVLDTPPSNATKRKKSVSSSMSSKGNFTVAEENKKLRMSNDATTTMRTEGHHDRDAAEDDGTQMKKCNSSHQSDGLLENSSYK